MLTVEFKVLPSRTYLTIVKCFVRNKNRWMSCAQIARKTKLRLSSVHRCLNSGRFMRFEREMRLSQGRGRNFYRLSPLGLKEARKS